MKKTRLLWSYKIEETEQWLEHQASRGYHLIDVNLTTRQFIFEKREPAVVQYQITYKQKNLEQLEHAGWERRVVAREWVFHVAQAPSIYPSRDRIFKRYRFQMYAWMTAILVLLPMLFLPLSMIVLISTLDSFVPFVIATILALVIEMTLVFSMFHFFQKQEKRLLGVQYKKAKYKKIKKLRIGWFYEPYRTKQWLQKMLNEGYELEAASNLFFYFKERSHEAVSYEILYENKIDPAYYQIHQQAGWELLHTSKTSILNTSLWAMPYKKGEEVPAITYDIEERKQVMKKNFKMTTTIFSILVLFLTLSVGMGVFLGEPFIAFDFNGITRMLNVILIVFWLVIYIRSVQGYRQELREIQDGDV